MGLKLCLQLACAVALATGPGLGAVPVAAMAARVRILDGEQLEVLFPVGTFLGERGWAETDFHPPGGSITIQARMLHITEVFVARDRAASKGSVTDRI